MSRCWFPPAIVAAIAWAVWPEAPLPLPASTPSTAPERGAVEAQLEADILALAQVAWGEDPQAIEAVVWVVLNRSGCRVAPLECRVPVLKEITRHRAFGTMLRGRFRPAWRPDGPAPVHAVAKVRAVVLGFTSGDPTMGSRFFHRKDSWTPPWAPHPRKWKLIGSHWFYKEAKR